MILKRKKLSIFKDEINSKLMTEFCCVKPKI